MQNPYEVLGLKEGASQDEIKAAYREQVKKYHPDKHQDNPLYELAQEKLQEINEAYEYLSKNQNGNAAYRSAGMNGQQQAYRGPGNAQFAEIRKMIDQGNLSGAAALLGQTQEQNAEWFFLSGMLSLRKGWYDDAVTKVQQATAMDPQNGEYRQALNHILTTANGYRTSAQGRGYTTNDDLCRLAQCYCCTNLCCNCM